MKKSTLSNFVKEVLSEYGYDQPTTLPKPGVKPTTEPESPPKRRRIGNPNVDPKPKAGIEDKIVQRFARLRTK